MYSSKYVKIISKLAFANLAFCLLIRCGNAGPHGETSMYADTLRHDTSLSAKPIAVRPQFNYNKFCGTWLRYDTDYAGRISSIDSILKDTLRLEQKIAERRNTGGCDGGCVYANV